MNKKIFVITNTQAGWDCVRDIYQADSEYDVKVHHASDCGIEESEAEQWFENNGYIVHEKYKINTI